MSDTTSIDAAAAQITALLTEIETSNARVVQAQDTGTADAYVCAPTPAVASYGPDLFLLVDIANANQTQTPKVNVSGLGWVNITASDGSQVAVGAIAGKCLLGFSSAAGGGYVARHMFAVSPSMLATLLAGLARGVYIGTLTNTSTANALVATLAPAVPAGVTDYLAYITVGAANTGATTFNGMALSDNRTGAALVGGELQTGGTALVRVSGGTATLLTGVPTSKAVFTAALNADLSITANTYTKVAWSAPASGTNPPFGTWNGTTLTITKAVSCEVMIGAAFDINCNSGYSGASVGLGYNGNDISNSSSPLTAAADQSYVQASGSDHSIGGGAARVMNLGVGDTLYLQAYGSSQSPNFAALRAAGSFLQVRQL